MSPTVVATAVVFALTYLVLGLGALPPLRLDRTGAALVGATLMVAIGALTPSEALASVDLATLALLFGMMVVAAHLRLAGFFGWCTTRVLGWTRSPRVLLVLTVWLSGVLSALFVNDTVCVLLTPLVVEVALTAGLPVVPFLLAVAMGSNAGRFAAALAPVALGALVIVSVVLLVAHARELPHAPVTPTRARARLHRPLLAKTLAVAAGLLVALLAGVPPALAAMCAASVLLVTRRVRPGRVHALVDGPLLALFAGLFVVVEGLERTGLAATATAALEQVLTGPVGFVAVTTVLSNLVSNVPAVLLLEPTAAAAADPERARLVLAMASTLAGNLTLVGSVANLIVVAQAGPHARVGFLHYARLGLPITLLTLVWGIAWLR